jgi:conjugative relaxase-like TrwC/TraI family protein
VLTLHKILGGQAGAYARYLTDIEDTGDYYIGPDGDPWAAPGTWLGRLGRLMGSVVERDALLAVLEGRDPHTGSRIVRIWRADRVAAHDLVFSAPSSVTAVWALADDALREAIQQAQDDAVREAFAYIERAFALVRRRDPSRRSPGKAAPIISEPAAALLGATFSHHTARQTAAQAQAGVPPDPQLHTHVLVPGMAQRRDGHFVAINSLELHRRRAEAGAVYRAALAANLAELGFAVERQTGKGGRYFEVAGVPVELRDLWSSRHQEIAGATGQWREEFHALAGRDPTIFEEREWAAKNRAPKGRYYRSDLFSFWREAAGQVGVTPEQVDALRHAGRQVNPGQGRARLVDELLSPEGVTREHATFDLQSLRMAAYEHAPGLISPADVERALADLLQDEEVVEIGPGVWTTREIRRLERRVLAWWDARTPGRVDEAVAAFRRRRTQPAARGPEKALPPPSPRVVEEALLRCPVRLSAEQREALDRILGGSFTALTGEAGTGKGVVLRVAADVWRQQHRRILAVAVGGAQAQRLAADLGPGTEALTLDAFTWRIQHDRLRLGPHDVVTLDEAGQVDTRRWAAFTEAVGGAATVVALGDHAQLSPISAGGLWPLLARGGPQLTEVRRTALEWQREAWAHLRRGESAAALDLYARRGNLTICATRDDALTAAVAVWDRDGRDGLIITDASNAERHRANTAAQTLRLAELGELAVTVATAEGEVAFHIGDPVLFTRQYRPPGLPRRVENGTTAEVIGVDAVAGTVRVRTHEAIPRELSIAMEGEACLDLYYASHVVKSQGTTVRRAYIVAGGWQTHRESLYVAMSRSREGTRLFVDRESLGGEVDSETLSEMVRRSAESRAKLAAIEGRLPRQPTKRRGVHASRHTKSTGVRTWHTRAHVLTPTRTERNLTALGVG